MGKQIIRVAKGFDWPLEKIWWGYELPEVRCQGCGTTGKIFPILSESLIKENGFDRLLQSEPCPTCKGKGKVRPIVEIPAGPGYQLWETTYGWSPISPAFESAEEVAHWLADHEVWAFGIFTLSYEKWLDCILEKNKELSILIRSHCAEHSDRFDEYTNQYLEKLFSTPHQVEA